VVVALCLLGLRVTTSQTGGLRRVTNTTDEGININPSLSGDGRRIAFESTEDLAHAGGSDHFRAIRADLASDPAVFTQLSGTRAPAPGISQDGSRIAFAAKEDPLGTNTDGNSEIFLFDGSTLRQITNTTPGDISRRIGDGNFQPSLTDDGRLIAFSSNRNLTSQNSDGNLEIFIFDTTSNTFTQLTNTTGTVGATNAKISGDGARVAYIRNNGALPAAQRDLVLQDRTGGTTRLIASNVTNLAFTYGRAISDDGLRIVYSGDIATDSSQVFLYDGRTSNSTRQITALGVRTTEVPLHPTISGDGTRIAFATRRPIAGISNSDNSIELYTFDIPTGQFARVTNAPSNADGFDGSSLVAEVVSSLNDDGSVVAFNFPRSLSGTVTTGLENNSEIYVTGTAARPTTGSLTVLNEASFGHEPSTTKAIAPDSNAVALGGALAFNTQQAPKDSNNTFPTTFGGTTVTVNGRRAQITFVSPTQVNFIVPSQTEVGTAEVVVTNEEGFQSRGTVTVLRAAPGIFTKSGDGQGEGVVLNANMQGSGTFDPSDGQLRLIIFTTGVRHATQVTASAGGRALTVESFMASPDMPGMDEVRVLVPADLRGAGTVNLVVRADGRDSNPVTIIFAGNACRDIVINEVLADPPDGSTGDANRDGARDSNDDEFVELVNTTANNIDISGYQLLTRSTSATSDTLRHTFAPGTLFPAGSAIVVFGGGGPNFDPTNAAFGGAQVFKTSSPGGLSLTNSGGVVTLRDPSQAIVNIFSYGGSTGLNGDANQSLTRSPDAGTNSECGNFTPHTTAPGSNGQPFSPGTRVDGSPFASGLGRLTSITISPSSASVAVGQTTQFTAQARDQFNRPLTNVTITFASDNTNVATVDGVTMDATTGVATATVTGRSEGAAHITAQATNGTTTVTSSQATLTVKPLPAVVTRVEVSPQSATINRGQTQQFTATAFDQNNQPIAGATFTWSSSDTNVATINSSGLATGVGLGSVTITATTPDATGAMVSGTATLNVQVPLVINEILPQVPTDNVSTTAIEGDSNRDGVRDSDDDEFVELLNNSNAPVNISGIIISDSLSNRFTFPANTTLAAGRAVIVFGGGSPPTNDPAFGGALIFTTSSLGLTDGGDTVTVKLPVAGTDVTIASLAYGTGTSVPAPGSQSLTRSPDAEVGSSGGSFVGHTTATNAAGRTFSPGTRADGTPFGSPAITRIEVSPTSATIDVGSTQAFTARAFSNTGGPEIEVQNVSFIWDSSDTSKATVAPTTGASTVAKGVASGNNISIRARAGAQLGTATLTVNSTPPVLTSVTISPTSATINAGQTQQFTGQALDQFGQPIGGVTVTFVSNNTTVATVDSVSPTSATGSATATVTGQTNGSAEIRASATNGSTTVTSSPATLTVAPVANPGDVLISEFRFRGPSGANDEFIELYNRTTAPIDISGYKIFRSNNAGATNLTATIGSGVTLGSGCHYLLTNSNSSGPYSGSVAGDQTYGTGVADDGGIALTIPGGTATTGIIDQVGLSAGSAYKEGTSLAPLTTNTNQSYERKPGGAAGNGTDTNNNASDFLLNANSSNPQSLSTGCLDLSTSDLGINKTDSPDPITTGSDVTYTINVINNGPGTAQSVVVTDNLPGSVTFVSCSSTGGGVCSGTGNNRTVTFSSLASGASATITLVATANGAGGTTITNTATVASSTSDPNTGNNSSTATTTVQAVAPTVSINDVVITEGDSGTKTVDFTVTLSASSTQSIMVGYSTSSASPATATADTDYVSTSGTLTFAPGETTKPVTVTIKGDTLVEPDETFFVNLSGATNAIILDGQGQGTITNDDTANLVISQIYPGGGLTNAIYKNDFIEIFNRGTTTVDFTLTPYSVQFLSTGGSTWAKTDITSSSIAPGQYFLIQEASGGAAGATLPTPDATGTINLTSTTPGKVALVLNNTLLTGNCPGDDGITPFNPTGSVDFVGYGGNASTANHCYEGSGPASFTTSNNTIADFRKAGGCTDTNDNATDFLVSTPSPRNTGSPVNNCSGGAVPNLSITDATVTEGNSGTVAATFTVQLSAPAQGTDVTFDIATADNTATVANNDYVAKTLTSQIIPAGQTTYTFSVTVNGDVNVEPNETFFVNVTNVSGATATDSQGDGTIQNDDQPTLSINDVAQAEGDSGTSVFTFTVSLSAPAPAAVTFDIATADDTATIADNDYVARSLAGQSIPAGNQTYTFDVTVKGDTIIEPNETFFVNVMNVSGATVTDGQGIGTIQNDDSPPVLSINDVTQNEGNAGTTIFTFTVSLSAPAKAGGVTFDIATEDATASAGSDYVARSLTSQTIPAGSSTYTFDVTVNGDTIFEPTETFNVNVANVTGATVGDALGIGTITNDDAQPTITIADAALTEGNAGTSLMTFTVTLSGASQSTISVSYATADSSATVADADYDSASNTLNFAPGDTSKSFTVTIHGDTKAEGDEMFLVNLSGATGATISDNQALGTIFLDDPFSIAALNTTYSENFDTLDQTGVSSTTPVAWTRAESGTNANTTYTANNGSSTTGDTYSYGTIGSSDRALGGLRTSTPSLVPTVGAFFRNDTGSTINTLQIAYTGEEWRLGSAGRTDQLDFQYSTNATSLTTGTWTDVNALDFTTPNTTTTGAKDGNNVANRTAISNTITGLTLAPGATVWIRWTDLDVSGADDGLAVDDFSITAGINTPALSINDVTLAEGGNATTTTFTFTVSLTSPAGPSGVSFTINTADGTTNPATAGSDYVAIVNGSGSITSGNTSTTVSVTVNGDTSVEPDETFFVNLTNVTGATVTDGQGLGTIQNDDSPALSIGDVTQAEGNSGTTTFTFNVSLTQPAPAGGVSFTINTADGTTNPATAGSDYVAIINGSGSILPGNSTTTVSVTVNGDMTVEPNETFFVNITNVSGATVSDGQGLGTITNDDVAAIPQPTAGQVIINEALVTSSNTTTRPDFVELYNTTSQTLDISGLVISFRGSGTTTAVSTVTLPGVVGSGTTTIAANSYFLVVNGASVLNSAGTSSVVADYNASASTFNLNDTTGAVKIELNAVKLDGLSYQTGATAAPAAFSGFGEGTIFNQSSSATTKDFSRFPNATDTDNNATDFHLNTSVSNVTPKATNN
jgi:hypothetical protein